MCKRFSRRQWHPDQRRPPPHLLCPGPPHFTWDTSAHCSISQHVKQHRSFPPPHTLSTTVSGEREIRETRRYHKKSMGGTGRGGFSDHALVKRHQQHRQLTGKALGRSQIGFVMTNCLPPALWSSFHAWHEQGPKPSGINEGLTLSAQPLEFCQCRQLA